MRNNSVFVVVARAIIEFLVAITKVVLLLGDSLLWEQQKGNKKWPKFVFQTNNIIFM